MSRRFVRKSREGENENLRILCAEINKILNKLKPEFVNNIFKVEENNKLVREKYRFNLETPEWS